MHTAIIIEPRKHAALEFVLKNMLTCLPNTWKLVFFHGSLNKTFAEELFNSLEECQKNRLQLVDLQIENLNQKTYSQFLATRTIIYDYIQFFDIYGTNMINI